MLPAVHTGFADQFERRVEPQGFAGGACTGCSSSHASSAATTCKPDLLSGGTYGHSSLSAALWVLPVAEFLQAIYCSDGAQGDPQPPITSAPQLGLLCLLCDLGEPSTVAMLESKDKA